MGFDIDVLTTDPSGKLTKEETLNGVKVKRFDAWAPSRAYYFSRELKRYLGKESNKYDIVHAHNYQSFPLLYAAQTKCGNKLIATPHYDGGGHSFFRNLLHVPYKFLAADIFRKADRIICVSEYERSLLMPRFCLSPEKIRVIPNGINLDEFSQLTKNRKDDKLILCVSRLEKYKGIQYLIQALSKLDRLFRLEIVGKGPYKGPLVKQANSLGVAGRVTFWEELSRSDLLAKYGEAGVFVLLSRLEAYAIVVGEALAAGTPCIVISGPLSQWVDNENCFEIYYPINVDVLARLIAQVIGTKAGCTKLLGWDEVARRVASLYREVWEGNLG